MPRGREERHTESCSFRKVTYGSKSFEERVILVSPTIKTLFGPMLFLQCRI